MSGIDLIGTLFCFASFLFFHFFVCFVSFFILFCLVIFVLKSTSQATVCYSQFFFNLSSQDGVLNALYSISKSDIFYFNKKKGTCSVYKTLIKETLF